MVSYATIDSATLFVRASEIMQYLVLLGEVADLAIDQPQPNSDTYVFRTTNISPFDCRGCRIRGPRKKEGGSSAEQYLVWKDLTEPLRPPGGGAARMCSSQQPQNVSSRILGRLLAHELVSNKIVIVTALCIFEAYGPEVAKTLGDCWLSNYLQSRDVSPT